MRKRGNKIKFPILGFILIFFQLNLVASLPSADFNLDGRIDGSDQVFFDLCQRKNNAPAATMTILPSDDWLTKIKSLKPGDVAQLSSGVYDFSQFGWRERKITLKGTKDNPIIIRGAGIRDTILNGSKIGEILRIEDSSNLILENFVFTNPSRCGKDGKVEYGWCPDDSNGDKPTAQGIVVKGGENIIIRDSLFKEIGSRGILTQNTDNGILKNLVVENNIFVDVGHDTASGDIAFGGGVNWTVRGNLFAGNVDGIVTAGTNVALALIERNIFVFHRWEDSIDIKRHISTEGGTRWSTIRANVIYANKSRFSGLTLQDSTRNMKVYGNVFHGTSANDIANSIWIHGRTSSGISLDVRDLEIIGNWFDGQNKGFGISVKRHSDSPAAVENVKIFNNIFTDYEQSIRLTHGNLISIYNNIFGNSPITSSISSSSYDISHNLYWNTQSWSSDNFAVVGTPSFIYEPVGPLADNSLGKGAAKTVLDYDLGSDIGLPQYTMDFMRLEPSIIGVLEQTFSFQEIKEALDAGQVSYKSSGVSCADVLGIASPPPTPPPSPTPSTPPPTTPPLPGTTSIPKTLSKPTIDGNLNDFAGAEKISFGVINGNTIDIWLMWDINNLYIGADIKDNNLQATLTTHDSNVWEDDGIEFVIDTLNDGGNPLRSDDYKILINALGTVLDTKKWDPVWESNLQHVVNVQGTLNDGNIDIGYTIEFSIPWSAFGLTVEVGDIYGMNFRNNDLDETRIQYTWKGSINTADDALDIQLSSRTINLGSENPLKALDLNNDNKINLQDLLIIIKNFKKLNFDPKADVNKDEVVDLFDLVNVARHFGKILS